MSQNLAQLKHQKAKAENQMLAAQHAARHKEKIFRVQSKTTNKK